MLKTQGLSRGAEIYSVCLVTVGYWMPLQAMLWERTWMRLVPQVYQYANREGSGCLGLKTNPIRFSSSTVSQLVRVSSPGSHFHRSLAVALLFFFFFLNRGGQGGTHFQPQHSRGRGWWISEIEASLVYRWSYRTPRENPVSTPTQFFFLMHVGILPACMCKAHGSQEGVTAPGTGVIASCELSWKAKIQPWSSRRAANVLHHSANANSWKLL